MILATPLALQDVWPEGTCYGCGPSNPRGLHIKSYWDGDDVICTFNPLPDHNAGFDNVMYGGLVASLCDCHSVWTAIAATYRHEGREHGSAPHISYVTGNLSVRFLRPTPLDQPTILRARVEGLATRKAIVRCDVWAGDQKTVEANVVAIRVPADKAIGSKHGRAEHSAE